jgi:hypothetical protein
MKLGRKAVAVLWRKINSDDPEERKEGWLSVLSEWLTEAEIASLAGLALDRQKERDEHAERA